MKLKLLDYTDHRNAPLPDGLWAMYQKWEDLMCMHIPVEPEVLTRYLPDALEIDTCNDHAWISIFTFNVQRMQLRGTA